MRSISVHPLLRKAESTPSGTITERVSADFIIDGASLLSQLVQVHGGHADFMGCFVRGFPEVNLGKKRQLLEALKPDTDEGRYLLYICPECGDIGCGAYAAKLRLTDSTAEWYDFAYENGYEPGCALDAVGPFVFARTEYNSALELACAA